MAISKQINKRARRIIDSGFGNVSDNYGGRFLRKDGRPNVSIRGITFLERFSFYYALMRMSWTRFILMTVVCFFGINLLFALLYFFIGVKGLHGDAATDSMGQFWEAFFFSTQTLTTVGYGHLAPGNLGVNIVAALEAMTGWLCFAIATGLIYGRFSRPRLHMVFSKNAVVAPFQEGTALMVKIAPFKENHNLMDVHATLTVAMERKVNGEDKNEFYLLELEYDHISALTLSWTIVHPINENSPFFGLSHEEILALKAEVLVFIKAFDDSFNTQVTARSSYTAEEIKFGYKFNTIFHRNKAGGATILELGNMNDLEKVALPVTTKPDI